MIRRSLATAAAGGSAPLVAVICGLPGAMGHEVASACLRRGIEVAAVGFTGPGMPASVQVSDGEGGGERSVALIDASSGDAADAALAELTGQHGAALVAIDYTHPSAVNANAELYGRHRLSFVMGTTGGDRERLAATAGASGGYAVIAPNMSKQIVGLTAGLERMAADFPEAFAGYSLSITESHQASKADTSGTAKDLARFFEALAPTGFGEGDIRQLRTDEDSLAFGVPREALGGHAFHTYALTSADGSVGFEFKHNVCGRRTYAEGTVDAAVFIAKRAAEGSEKRLYDMVDLLKAGGL